MVWHLGMGGLTKRFTKRPCFGNKTDQFVHVDCTRIFWINKTLTFATVSRLWQWNEKFCPYKNANWSHIIMHGVLASFLSGFGKLASTDDTNTNGHSFHSAHIVEWNRGRERTFSSWEAQIFCGSPFDMFWWRGSRLESGDVFQNCLTARHWYVIWLTLSISFYLWIYSANEKYSPFTCQQTGLPTLEGLEIRIIDLENSRLLPNHCKLADGYSVI